MKLINFGNGEWVNPEAVAALEPIYDREQVFEARMSPEDEVADIDPKTRITLASGVIFTVDGHSDDVAEILFP